MNNLTVEEVENHLDKIQHSFQRDVCATCWMGIEISWQRKPKKNGGNILRNKTWGVWEYTDLLNGKELSREGAIATILKPFAERKAEADLTNIKYCAMCHNIAVGEDEQLTWGRLSYVCSITTYKSTGHKSPNYKYVDICLDCCKKIIRSKP